MSRTCLVIRGLFCNVSMLAPLPEHLWLEMGWRNHCPVAEYGRNVASLSQSESPVCKDPSRVQNCISTREPKPCLPGAREVHGGSGCWLADLHCLR